MRFILVFAYATGPRISKLVAVTLRSVHVDDHDDHWLRLVGKGSKPGKVALPPLARSALHGRGDHRAGHLAVGDYLMPDGAVRVTSAVRPNVAHNGTKRALYWSNKRVIAAVDAAYPAWRFTQRHGRTIERDAYRGLDLYSPLFLADDGEPYSLTKRTLPSGFLSYSCNTLGAYISRLHANAGIEGGSAQSARRTLAVKLHRKGYDLIHIAAILGHKSVSTTKRLVTQDPVRLADIVAKAL